MTPEKKNKKASTRKAVPIGEIRNDTLVMKDGTLRAVLMVSSINFALKSADEQQAIISAYMQFLNSITYPIQIVIQSRRINIDKYLEKLQKMEKEQVNELLKIQIVDYRKYVSELVELGDIMTKKFYIVIPYNPLSDKQKSFFSRSKDLLSPKTIISLSEKKFFEREKELSQRVSHVASSLGSIGLAVTRVDTQGLIELFYNSYNPDVAEHERMVDVNKIRFDNIT
ncbi:MAG: TraC family protein [Patescibacteria group bacterium]|jgi:hypothetical protein